MWGSYRTFERSIHSPVSCSLNKLWVTVLCMLVFPGKTYADAWEIEPSVTLEGSYDDNVRLTIEDEDKVFAARIAGALKLTRSTETTDLEGLVRLDGIKYAGDDERLNDKPNQLAGFSAARKGERYTLGLDGLLRRDTVLRTVDLFVDPQDPQIEEDESVDDDIVTREIRRNRITARPSWSYAWTERTDIGLEYQFRYTDYDDDEDLDLNSFKRHTVIGRLNTQVTERDSLVTTIEGGRFDSENDNNFDNVSGQVGVRRDFDETTSATITVGGRFVSFETATQEGDDREEGDDAGFLARFQGRKLAGLTRFDLRIERTLSPSGSGDLVQTDQLNFNVARKLTEFVTFSLRSRIFENESIRRRASNTNRRALRVEPELSWQLTPNFSLETTYRYSRRKRFGQPDAADSNAFFVSLVYRRPTPLEAL